MPDSPGVITVSLHELRRTSVRCAATGGAAVRLIDGARPDFPPLWLTDTPPSWYGTEIEDDLPALRELQRRAIHDRNQRGHTSRGRLQALSADEWDG